MIENIKVDIIYYLTATDFEFEFNLGGCCRMRLLNDKVSDKKSFVNSLARAVSRSQIILTVGPLFGEDGLIATAAAAISHSLQTVDNKAYGIASQDKIEVIEGAVPLVTREGYFGGCIIESGNQSIILLTENRTVRKAIMKTLVHPYIEDMCIMQSTGRSGVSAMPEPVSAEKVQPQEEPKTEVPAEEIPVPEEEQAAEPEVIEESSGDTIEEDILAEKMPRNPSENSMEIEFFEPEEEESQADVLEEVEQDTENLYFMPGDDDEDDDGDEEREVGGKRGKGLNIAIFIVAVLLLLVVFAILYFTVFMPMVGGMSTSEYLEELFSTASKV